MPHDMALGHPGNESTTLILWVERFPGIHASILKQPIQEQHNATSLVT